MESSCKKHVSWASPEAIPFIQSPSTTHHFACTSHHASSFHWTTISYKKKFKVVNKAHSYPPKYNKSSRFFTSSLPKRCLGCLASDHLLRDCREPRRCRSCMASGLSAASYRRRLRELEVRSPLPEASPPLSLNNHAMLASAVASLGFSAPPSSFKQPIASAPSTNISVPPHRRPTTYLSSRLNPTKRRRSLSRQLLPQSVPRPSSMGLFERPSSSPTSCQHLIS